MLNKIKIEALPISKSIFIRKLLIHYLYFDEILLLPDNVSHDVQIVADNLERVRQSKFLADEKPVLLDVEDCGAAYRFLLPLLCVTPGQWCLTGTPRLQMRPLWPLAKTLQMAGAEIKRKEAGWLIQGRSLLAEKLILDATDSSQFVSALLLSAPLLHLKNLTLTALPLTSKGYIDLTVKMLEYYGMEISETETGYVIRNVGLQKRDFNVENDWSAAAYWYAVAALTGNSFFLPDLFPNSGQPDAAISRYAKAFWKVETTFVSDGVRITSLGKIPASQFAVWDCSNTPDLIPIVAVMSVLTKTDCQIIGCESLNQKESQRLAALYETLSAFAPVEISDNQHQMTIYGQKTLFPSMSKNAGRSLKFDACQDHRLVMAYSLFGLFQPVDIKGFEYVKKSYPSFEPFYNF